MTRCAQTAEAASSPEPLDEHRRSNQGVCGGNVCMFQFAEGSTTSEDGDGRPTKAMAANR